jgi:hypothetical protein
LGAISGGLQLRGFFDRVGRRRATAVAILCPFMVVPFWRPVHTVPLVLRGVFLRQFFVQVAGPIIAARGPAADGITFPEVSLAVVAAGD